MTAPHPPSNATPAPQYAPPPMVPGPGGVYDGARDRNELGRPLYRASPFDACVRFFKNYVNFRGRASRSEFWWMVLATWLGMMLLTLGTTVTGSMLSLAPGMSQLASVSTGILGMITWVVLFGITIPWLSLGWRRLQDVNIHGAWYLVILFPSLGMFAVLIMAMLSPKVAGRRFDSPTR